MRFPWKKPALPASSDPLAGLIWEHDPYSTRPAWCEFCDGPDLAVLEFEGSSFCSRWCINYYILNGHKMASKCDGCGWRGCAVDFVITKSGDTLCAREHTSMNHGGGQPCWQGVSDEEFEAYRAQIVASMRERPLRAIKTGPIYK